MRFIQSGNQVLFFLVLLSWWSTTLPLHLILNDWVVEELFHGGWDVIGVCDALLRCNLLIHQIALEDSIGADVEDGHEHRCDEVTDKEYNGERGEGRIHAIPSHHDKLAKGRGADRDEELSQEHEHISDTLDKRELCCVLKDEDEGVECG